MKNLLTFHKFKIKLDIHSMTMLLINMFHKIFCVYMSTKYTYTSKVLLSNERMSFSPRIQITPINEINTNLISH